MTQLTQIPWDVWICLPEKIYFTNTLRHQEKSMCYFKRIRMQWEKTNCVGRVLVRRFNIKTIMALAAISLAPTFPGVVSEATTSLSRLSPTLPSPCWCLLYLMKFPHKQHYPESAAAADVSRGWPLWLCSWENLGGVNTLGWEKNLLTVKWLRPITRH